MLYRISVIISYLFFKLFCNLEVKGKECFDFNTPFILASNHYSHLDPPVLAVSCPKKIGFLAKEELFNNRLFVTYLNGVGAIPLKRGKSDIRIMRLVLKTLKNKPVLIFPQGTRGGSFDEANVGVGFLCKKAGVPIIAAKIFGSDKVLPKGAKSFHRAKIKVVFGRVDNIKSSDSHKEITAKVIAKIKAL